VLSFAPRLPEALTRLALNLRARKTVRLRIQVEQAHATYTLLMGERFDIEHYGEPITLTTDQPVQRPIPPANQLEPPNQPRGRAPLHRRGAAR
jgi:alpha,alpha-trehalose phosphorylase